ncbi:replicase polyprotein 1ab [Striga asiatica]|uniref:Replicase polyprotein 1ab n=1 Tax=Striga asiatica TaxID=4170 RepID=A0A5A7PRC0_STRAF|nr:replicase polyprotein 1ab [Striga asiatica]
MFSLTLALHIVSSRPLYGRSSSSPRRPYSSLVSGGVMTWSRCRTVMMWPLSSFSDWRLLAVSSSTPNTWARVRESNPRKMLPCSCCSCCRRPPCCCCCCWGFPARWNDCNIHHTDVRRVTVQLVSGIVRMLQGNNNQLLIAGIIGPMGRPSWDRNNVARLEMFDSLVPIPKPLPSPLLRLFYNRGIMVSRQHEAFRLNPVAVERASGTPELVGIVIPKLSQAAF